jgi:hypothetical protein
MTSNVRSHWLNAKGKSLAQTARRQNSEFPINAGLENQAAEDQQTLGISLSDV